MSESPRLGADELESKVMAVVAELVAELRGPGSHRRLGRHDSLERDLGISSLERVELLIRLERACGVRLPDAMMVDAESPADLTAALERASPGLVERMAPVAVGDRTATGTPTEATTLVEALAWHAERTPDRVHIHLREDDGRETPLTYGELWRAAHRVAAGLAARGLGRHDTVALMLRTEQAFFSSFFGTLLAGCVPVPIYPPFRADRIQEYAERQVAILRNAATRILVTFADVERVAGLLVGQVPSLSAVVTPDTLMTDGATAPSLSTRGAGQLTPDDPALIQYTSGSTGQPKGVLLSHANLLANVRALETGLEIDSHDVGVSWLPLYHDMGLIGTWLGLLYVGRPLALMSPLAFLSRPSRWLWSFHAHRGTISAAPNFAYDLCALRVTDDEIEGLDLSSVRALLNGAEAVQPDTLNRFAERFAAYGLKREALTPVYGLAECSVGLAAPPMARGPRIDVIERRVFQETGAARESDADNSATTLRVVACGRALPGHEIRVVDASGDPLSDRQQGRVEFRGPSATLGYYRNPNATNQLVGPDGWLRTGDLGYLVEGELYLTGRAKELIIKGGRNLQPHEAEDVAAAVEGVRKGCVAAFGVSDPTRGTERFVIVAETRLTDAGDRARLEAAVTKSVSAALGVPPDVVALAGPGAVLKTSSGKIRRSATREAFLHNRLSARRPAVVQWAYLGARAASGFARDLSGRAGSLAFTAWVLAVLLVSGPVVWAILAIGPRGLWVNRCVGGWARFIFRMTGCPVDVTGTEHLRDLGQAVFVANHASFIDPVLIMSSIPAQLRFAVKAQLADYPFLGTAIQKAEHILIGRNPRSQHGGGAGALLPPLHHGESLLIFPEGTFVAAPGLLPFRLGAFRAAVDVGCPVVPVAIRGTRHILPADRHTLKRGRMAVTIGEPIWPTGTAWEEIVRLRDEARQFIARESGESVRQ